MTEQPRSSLFLARNLREFEGTLGGTGGESVNSAGYSLIEYGQSERAKNTIHCFSSTIYPSECKEFPSPNFFLGERRL